MTLEYRGLRANQPSLFVTYRQQPTTQNINFPLCTIWLSQVDQTVWVLTNKEQGVATWQQLSGSTGDGLQDIVTDAGTATQISQQFDVLGTQISTSGTSNIVTVATDQFIEIDTLTVNLADGVLISNASGVLSTIKGDNGELILGGTTPAFAALTSSDGSVTFSTGTNFLQISSAGSSGANEFNTDSGTATPALGVMNFFGDGTNISTTGDGSNTITINTEDDITVDTVTLTTDLTTTDTTATTYSFPSLSEGVLETNTSSELTVQSPTNGQTPISPTTSGVVWNTLTDTATVTITNNPGSITINANGGGSSMSFLGISNTTFTMTQNTDTSLGSTAGSTLTVIENGGGTFTGGNGAGTPARFTAAETGLYRLGLVANYSVLGSNGLYRDLQNGKFTTKLITTGRTYEMEDRSCPQRSNFTNNDTTEYGVYVETFADMTAGDTAHWTTNCRSNAVNTSTYVIKASAAVEPSGPTSYSLMVWGLRIA